MFACNRTERSRPTLLIIQTLARSAQRVQSSVPTPAR
jgi:hypothetical protein